MIFSLCKDEFLENITAIFLVNEMLLKDKIRTGGQIILVPTDDLIIPEFTYRINVGDEELHQLSMSMTERGVLTPLTVKALSDGSYEIVSGVRRYRAAKSAGFSYLPCVLIECDEIDRILISLCENTHRRTLHYLEYAEQIEILRKIYSVEQISTLLSIPEGVILSRIKLLSLPDDIKLKIIAENIDEVTANKLSRITDKNRLYKVAEYIVSDKVSFSEAMRLTEKPNLRTVVSAHFKDYTVFNNTIEHAIETMRASGINTSLDKFENEEKIVYTMVVNKLI